ncbi:MAG TPA: hypothetical protein VD887_13035 [Allosphingosinicella sp.]|nr:hypothetical protein [Allosphingosinicella sp.]
MAGRALISVGLMALAPILGTAQAATMDESGIRPARDGDIAIGQELDAARRAGTLAAYDLFIARHPEHPLARAAREERGRLARQLRQRR